MIFPQINRWGWADLNAGAPTTHRRGKQARGRARLRGRRLWWLIVVVPELVRLVA